MLYTVMRSITNVIHIYLQSNTNANTGGLCRFRYGLFTNFWLWFFDKKKETQFLKASADHTILQTILYWPHKRAAHPVMFKISIDGNPKIPTASFNGQNSTQLYASMAETQLSAFMIQSQLTLFQNPPILRTLSSGHNIIHTPASFPVWGFIMTMMIVIFFAHKRKLHQLTIYLGS